MNTYKYKDLILNIFDDTYQFSFIPNGEFYMGSEAGLPLELPVHKVSIRQPFYVSKNLINQHLWKQVMGDNPAKFCSNPNNPAENIPWVSAQKFCDRLSEILGRKIRLPSESEWEYFCRATSTTEYFYGESYKNLTQYAWTDLNAMDTTHPIGSKLPNCWDIYDIAGNVWEWCEDDWVDNYIHGPFTEKPTQRNDDNSKKRKSIRGGSFDLDHYRCRSAYRSFEHADFSSSKIGFRIVIEINDSD